jgi:hypothetical protein
MGHGEQSPKKKTGQRRKRDSVLFQAQKYAVPFFLLVESEINVADPAVVERLANGTLQGTRALTAGPGGRSPRKGGKK